MSRTGEGMSKLAKRRSGWLVPLAVFFVTACLSALLLAYYFAPARPGQAEEEPAPTDATRTIALSVGSHALRVPANYILMASARRGGPMTQVALIVILPDLQGYTLGAAPDLTSNAPDSKVIHIVLKSGTSLLPEQERLERIYMTQVEDSKGKLGPYGLRQYAFRSDSGYHDQDLFVGMTDGGPAVLLCAKIAPEVVSPSCMRDLPFGDNVTLSYRFKRAHLSEWRKIDSGIRARLAEFSK
jgi:hypothetical protein